MKFATRVMMGGAPVLIAAVCLALSGCSNRCDSNPLAPAWQQVFTGKTAYFLSQSADGGFVIAGVVPSDDGYSGPPYLAKTNSEGQDVWSADLVGADFIRVEAVVEGADGTLFVAGYGQHSALLAGVDSDGEILWTIPLDEIDADDYYAESYLVATSDGNGVMAYYAESEREFALDINVVKFDSDGTILWGQSLDDGQSDYFSDLLPTEDGGVTLLTVDVEDYSEEPSKLTPAPPRRSRLIRLSEDGTERWSVLAPREFDYAYNVAEAKDDGLVLLASDRIARFNKDGGVDWVKGLALEHNNGFFGLSPILRTVPGDGYVIGGSSYSFFAWFIFYAETCGNSVLVKLDDDGTIQWEREYGTAAIENMSDMVVTSEGDFVVVGETNPAPYGGFRDTFLMKVDGGDPEG